ncbi:MAG TPA: 16S rRNA (uracil(1498)-N(3))-methyltransferase [Jatrophihabitans sp.]|jgi:16S rRNA (uracil1498-N3)-methyltransferase
MSTAPLFLLDPLPAGESISLTGDEGRHAARVKRLGVGERVLISDGRGAVAECAVAEVLPDGLRLSVMARRAVPEPTPRLVVVQALPKGERADLAVEVMTELGVDEIVPWAASRSIVRWDGARGAKALEKWRRTAAEAAKQSRRARVPLVAELASTEQVAAILAGSTGLVLHESAQHGIGSVTLSAGRDVVVVVGPEGGISDGELAHFIGAGAVAVRLGESVLRTSTAGAAALAALSLRLDRWV